MFPWIFYHILYSKGPLSRSSVPSLWLKHNIFKIASGLASRPWRQVRHGILKVNSKCIMDEESFLYSWCRESFQRQWLMTDLQSWSAVLSSSQVKRCFDYNPKIDLLLSGAWGPKSSETGPLDYEDNIYWIYPRSAKCSSPAACLPRGGSQSSALMNLKSWDGTGSVCFRGIRCSKKRKAYKRRGRDAVVTN